MDELLKEVCVLFQNRDAYDDDIKSKLILILSNYEISKRNTEITLYDCEDYNQQIISRFLINKTVAGMTERTIKFYGSQLKFTFSRINKPINQITSDDIKLYLAKRQVQDKVGDVTVGNEWRVLSAFYGWLHREELIEKNPMYKVDKPKQRKKKKKAFSSMECELIRNSCDNLREKAIVEVLFSTWSRVSEIEQMDISDIEGDSLTVVGKGKKERIVYLNSKAQLAIKNYLENRDDNNPALFVSFDKPYNRLLKSSIEKTVREIGKRAGVENVHPHRFRRTGATIALRSGMPIEKVSFLLGHESIETTQIYLDINEDEVKQAHKKYVN